MALLSLFTMEQASCLTRLSSRQLAEWERVGLYRPHIHDSDGVFRRVYTLRDVIRLRALALLRIRVSIQHLRQVKAVLHRYENPWSSLTFWVGGRTVFWQNPDQGTLESTCPPRQTVMPIMMRVVEADVVREVETLLSAFGRGHRPYLSQPEHQAQ